MTMTKMDDADFDNLFTLIDEYADARAAVAQVLQRVGHDESMAAYFAPAEYHRRSQARAAVRRELARFVRAVVAGEIL